MSANVAVSTRAGWVQRAVRAVLGEHCANRRSQLSPSGEPLRVRRDVTASPYRDSTAERLPPLDSIASQLESNWSISSGTSG